MQERSKSGSSQRWAQLWASKVSAGTAECHILVLNDMKTVKALPSLDFCREGKADAGLGRMWEGLRGQKNMKKAPFENGVGTCN